MKFTALIQARLNSTRYPRKMELALIDGKTILEHIIHRLEQTKSVEEIILAVPHSDVKFFMKYAKRGVSVVGGDEASVLKRFVDVAETALLKNEDWILRICGDAPFPEPLYINHLAMETEEALRRGDLIKEGFEASVILDYPLGRQVEAFKLSCLKRALLVAEANDDWEVLEHIDPLLDYKSINNKPLFKVLRPKPFDFSLDTEEDEFRLNETY